MYILLIAIAIFVLGLFFLKNKENYAYTPELINIKPKIFKVGGVMTQPQPRSASLCNHNVLYPINGLGVDYGSQWPDNCPAARFIQSP